VHTAWQYVLEMQQALLLQPKWLSTLPLPRSLFKG
jgi:hypothetical protein